MQEVKWIKMDVDLFNNRKIRQIECLPDGNAIIVAWIKLLCLAGTVNDSGLVYFTKEIPYTEQMLSAQFNMPIALVQVALRTFENFGMIEVIDDVLKVSNWEKYQNIEGMERIREQTRARVAKCRERKALCNATSNATVTQGNAIDIDIEIEKEIDIEDINTPSKADVKAVIDRWNTSGFPKIVKLSPNTKRYKSVVARIKEYGIDDVMTMIQNASESDYLHGKNKYGWQASFEWCFLPNNFPKVLEGNYENRTSGIDELIGEFLSRGER